MINKYSKIYLKSGEVKEWAGIWCEENLNNDFALSVNETEQRICYTIVSNYKEIKIDLIRCSEGRFTICYKVGSNIDISEQIAEYILDRSNSSKVKSAFNNGFSVISNEETFNAIIDFLNEFDEAEKIGYNKFNEIGKAKYEQYKYKSNLGDSIVIKFFESNSRIQIQGKPLYLFNCVEDILVTDPKTVNGLVDAHLKYCNVDIPKNDIYEEMKSTLGNDLYNFLTTTQKAILSSAFIFNKIDIDMDDYSSLIIPAARALEGYILKLISQSGVIMDERKLGNYFYYDDCKNQFLLKEIYIQKINSENRTKSITTLYRLYHKRRHPYSHSTERDYDTSIIVTRKDADSKFRELIDAMKTSYINCI
ncbi:type II toxin-antitoxin system RnlA family toxin [[Clostridium] fimetarium]|uniref:RNase LS, toxin n=1 Tax=[Clostridium] fimetarium TaxID=99656 RepID=A0A1I0M210_9FIRM|nr:type II toxin-antitoxin system RnlA family toxin [[Clostridium] fimetarium]SEV81779.1 RNase LS, toxin [[Clostridium] fimetarium]